MSPARGLVKDRPEQPERRTQGQPANPKIVIDLERPQIIDLEALDALTPKERGRLGLEASQIIDLDAADTRVLPWLDSIDLQTLGLRKRRSKITLSLRTPSSTSSGSGKSSESSEDPEEVIDTYIGKGRRLRLGDNVQLSPTEFLRIVSMTRNKDTDEVRLRGYKFGCNRSVRGFLSDLESASTEVCWLLDVDRDDPRPAKTQGMVDCSVLDVVSQGTLVMTNDLKQGRPIEPPNYTAWPVFCRQKYIRTYASSHDRKKGGQPIEEELSRLTTEECDPGYKISLDDLRAKWREDVVRKGGSYYGYQPLEVDDTHPVSIDLTSGVPAATDLTNETSDVIDLRSPSPSETSTVAYDDDDDAGPLLRETNESHTSHKSKSPDLSAAPLQRYSFFDGFCGCGGTTRGAVMAGLVPIAACDLDKSACTSYMASFPSTKVACADIFSFITDDRYKCCPDVSHLSPVCKTFSPAHTTPGKDDEKNRYTLLSCTQHLRFNRPRISTLENTFGLTRIKQHNPDYEAMINMYTSEGYSIRWAVLDLSKYGVPQTRRRLIVIAAAPGEILPAFPPPTHGDAKARNARPGLRPLETINSTLRQIPGTWQNHNPRSMEVLDKEPYDGNVQAKTVTCAANFSHPSGKRDLTIRELASLQTFPLTHNFGNHAPGELKKQIGNAVPPLFAYRLYQQIHKTLLLRDGLPTDSAAGMVCTPTRQINAHMPRGLVRHPRRASFLPDEEGDPSVRRARRLDRKRKRAEEFDESIGFKRFRGMKISPSTRPGTISSSPVRDSIGRRTSRRDLRTMPATPPQQSRLFQSIHADQTHPVDRLGPTSALSSGTRIVTRFPGANQVQMVEEWPFGQPHVVRPGSPTLSDIQREGAQIAETLVEEDRDRIDEQEWEAWAESVRIERKADCERNGN